MNECFKLSGIIFLYALAMAPGAWAIEAGSERRDEAGVTQLFVPAGCFQMGTDVDVLKAQAETLEAPDWAADAAQKFEVPAHHVCLTNDYWIDRTEVSNADFAAFVAAGGYEQPDYWSEAGKQWLSGQYIGILPLPCDSSDAPDHPRACITFYEAEAYATWRGGRLPTEAEWEYAARGPQSRVFPWGNEWIEENAHIVGQTGTAPVGQYVEGASWIGALNMSGNVMEWVQDWLGEGYYASSPTNDPTGPETGSKKAEKGGWWGSNPFVARSAYKHYEDGPSYNDAHIGFRVVTPAENP
ncbi:formylglycine-generating enzyme required for sulfatase activity [Maritalea mobilis]|uniref:Formylglycine-generating enzyme required for sulfatase activity n=1 Tax=Maritalea mobilis TaxID=483324 RepID=A0A4R6VV39_9HYPH|nr:SUMF1/EgtB/PvdO family nonheme iron enzyme [Maritalea mobilis]TDQ66470.1 formylglycine-generating enzyme required for sulfatase activity [Maritalea mobilis]